MKNKLAIFTWIFLFFSLPLQSSTNEQSIFKNGYQNSSKSILKNDLLENDLLENDLLENENLYIKINKLFKLIANNIEVEGNKREPKNEEFNLEIFSDTQSNEGDIFYADGNVFARSNNLILKTDKLVYDLKSKIIFLKGNIYFNNKDQFLKATEVKYDLNNKKGYINDAYGTVNFNNLNSIRNENIADYNFEDIESIKNVFFNSSSGIVFENIKFKGDGSLSQTLKVNLNEMQKWRFKADFIEIENDIWFSEKLFLTNDPFNNPQLVIDNRGFKSKDDEGDILITSKWSTLILDNFVKLPIGPRRIKLGEDNTFRWGIGYENIPKDGLFITRYYDPIDFSSKNTKLNIRQEFYIQRWIKGQTDSFSGKNQSVLAEKVSQDLNLFDYTGLEGDLYTKINDLEFSSNFSLNSLDFEKFKKILTTKNELSKLLHKEEKTNSYKDSVLSIFGNYREKVWNGSIGEREILSAYGMKLQKNKYWTHKNMPQFSSFALTYGDYQSGHRLYPDEIINRKRLNLFFQRKNSYPIWVPEIKDYSLKKDLIYSPQVINYGLNLLTESKLDLYRYDDYNYQNLFTIKGGPEITLGNFKNKYFDYTKLSFIPKATISSGKSPFGFDQSVDNHAIEIKAKQQLVGALAFEYSTEYNLDINSSKYKEFINTKYELSWNRRAYNFSLYYNSQEEVGGINFKIHSFNFEGLGEKFE